MTTEQIRLYPPDQYFGVSILDLGPDSAELMRERLEKSKTESNMFFDVATPFYHRTENALTVIGYAQSPAFAVGALIDYARAARYISEARQPE